MAHINDGMGLSGNIIVLSPEEQARLRSEKSTGDAELYLRCAVALHREGFGRREDIGIAHAIIEGLDLCPDEYLDKHERHLKKFVAANGVPALLRKLADALDKEPVAARP